MLELPILQSANPSARTQPTNGKAREDGSGVPNASSEFEAQYEEAGAQTNSVDGGSDAETAAKGQQSSDPDETVRQALDTEETTAESTADLEILAGAKDDIAISEETSTERKPQDRLLVSRNPAAEDAPTKGTTPLQGNDETKMTVAAGAPGDAQPEDAAAVPSQKAQNSKISGTMVENAVMAKASATSSEKTTTSIAQVTNKPDSKPDIQLTTAVPTTQNTAQSAPVAPPQDIAAQSGEDRKTEKRDVRLKDALFGVKTSDLSKSPPQKLAPQPPVATGTMTMANPKISVVKEKADNFLAPIGDLEVAAPFEQRANGTAGPTQATPVLNRPETPAAIARQMAEALQRVADRPVELSLNPKELGRVRMSISAAEAGITVNVIAERPETLDLMRRNIDQLSREFEGLGYSDIDFAFAEGDAQQEFDQQDSEPSEQTHTFVDLESTEMNEVPPRPVNTPVSGVDIRL